MKKRSFTLSSGVFSYLNSENGRSNNPRRYLDLYDLYIRMNYGGNKAIHKITKDERT